jgi:hypothetical protein
MVETTDQFKASKIKQQATKIQNSMALQVVFEYQCQADQIRMQQLNRRFYNYFTPSLVQHVTLYELGNVACGIMVFPGQEKFVQILDFNKRIEWF